MIRAGDFLRFLVISLSNWIDIVTTSFFYVYRTYVFIYFGDDLEESTYEKSNEEFRESQIYFK